MFPRRLPSGHGDPRGMILLVLNSVFLGLAAVTVGIRLWSRRIQRHGLVLNDYAVIISWIFAASLVILSNIGTTYSGAGKYIDSMDSASIAYLWKIYTAAIAMWAAANTSTKISVVHFYVTIFRSNRVFLIAASGVIVLVIAFGFAALFADVLNCRPLSKYWNPTEPGVCVYSVSALLIFTACNAATDLMIVFLPMPLVWGLQMATRRKIELTVIFALGFLVCTVASVRLILYVQLDPANYKAGVLKVSVVTALEPLLGIITACLPLCRPAIKVVARHINQTKVETRNVLASSMARARSKRLKNSGFRRFDHSLLFTDLEDNKSHGSISSSGGNDECSFDGCGEFVGVRIPPRASILIGQDCEIPLDVAGRLQEKPQL